MTNVSAPQPLLQRLQFLARVVARESRHLEATSRRLFSEPMTPDRIMALEADEDLAERVEAFVSRFGRLQDTLGDKLLPQLLTLLGERPASMVDNLDRAERLGWIDSSDRWLESRKLRNQMVHDYMEDPVLLADALENGHRHTAGLLEAAARMVGEIGRRTHLP